MNKIFALLAVFALTFAVAGCPTDGDKDKKGGEDTKSGAKDPCKDEGGESSTS